MMGEVIRVSANRPNVRDFLREEMLSQKFADVTLCCSDGQRFFVHRIVLSAASAYLQEMLLSHMKSTNTCEPITVILAEIEAPELAALLGFVYTGSASIPGERLDALLRAAETLHIQLPVLPSSTGDFSSYGEKEAKRTSNPGFFGCSRYPASFDDYLRVPDCTNSESEDCNCTGMPKLQSPMGMDQKLEQLHQRKQRNLEEEALPRYQASPHYYYCYHYDKKSPNGQSKSRISSTECLDYSQPREKRMTTTTMLPVPAPIGEYRLPAGTGSPANEDPAHGRTRAEKDEEMDTEEKESREEEFDERILGKDLRQVGNGNRWRLTRRRIVANHVTASPWTQLVRPHHSPKVPPMVLQLHDGDVADKDSEPRDLRHLRSSTPLEQRSPILPVPTTSRLVENKIPFPAPLESASSQLTCLSLSGSTSTPIVASTEFYHSTRHYHPHQHHHHHHQHQQHHQIKPNEEDERSCGAIEQSVPLEPPTAFPRPADVRNLVRTSSSSLSSSERFHVQERPSNRETDQKHVRDLLTIAPTTTSFVSPAEETQRCQKPEISHPVSRLCDTVSEGASESLEFRQFESIGGKVPIEIARSVVSDNNNNDASGIQPQRGGCRSSEHHKCEQCGKTFVTRASLKVHSRTHSGEKPFRCADCGKEFSQLRNYKYHRSVHEGTREFAATCPECGKYFNDRGYLSSHMKIHRNRKEYVCSECGKSFNQRVAYNMHVRIHTGVKPHQCEQCGKSFSRKMLLKQHLRTHSGERPYQCQVCHKAFADRSNMTLHTRLHSGLKPYQCTLCSKAFTKKHHLKTHLNYHTGTKPYSCPNCSLKFSQSSNMRTHYKKCLLNGSPTDAKTTVRNPVEDQRTLTPPTSDQESSLLSSIARSSAATAARTTATAAPGTPPVRD